MRAAGSILIPHFSLSTNQALEEKEIQRFRLLFSSRQGGSGHNLYIEVRTGLLPSQPTDQLWMIGQDVRRESVLGKSSIMVPRG